MNRGFLIIEVIITVAIFGLVGLVLLNEVFYSQRNDLLAGNLNQATALAQEGIEIIKNIRDAEFYDLGSDKKGLLLTNNEWQLVNQPEIIDNFFKRKINIVDLDQWRKEITVTVNEARIVARFANWFGNIEDWRTPYLGGSFDFTPENSGANNHNAQTATARGRYLYVGNANSNGKEFMILNIYQSPDLTIKGSINLDGSPNKIVIAGNYAYIASDSNTEELQVVNISDPANPFLTFVFNLTTGNSGNDNNDAISLEVAGTKLVLGRKNSAGEELFIFDVSIADFPNLIGWLQLDGNPNDLKIFNNKVFIASDDNQKELQIADISNPALPLLAGSFNIDSNDNTADGLALDLTAARLYVGREGSNSAPELYLFNIENPAAPALVSAIDLGGLETDIKHVSFASIDNLVFLLTADNNSDFKVISVNNDALSILSQLNVSGSPGQADYSFLTQQMFIVGKANPEVQIVAPTLIDRQI